jgi:hypothetical protein
MMTHAPTAHVGLLAPFPPGQDIGKTLAQLNITVEAAVNAGLLGGLSASGALQCSAAAWLVQLCFWVGVGSANQTSLI